MIREAAALTKVNLQSLPQRWSGALIDVFGVALVVAVFVGLFSTVSSYRSILVSNADDTTLLVMQSGAGIENESSLSLDEVGTIETAAKASDAGALVSPEMTRLIAVKQQQGGGYVNVALRGVTSSAAPMRSKLKLTSGRFIESGKYELLVGRGGQQQFAGLALGSTLRLADTDWTVVGVFEAGGGAVESEIWADLHVLQSAYRLGSGVQTVRVRTASAASADAFSKRIKDTPTLGVSVQPESGYYKGSVSGFFTLVGYFAWPLLIVMAVGAVFAGLNTMYGAVAARTREIGTARALGFGATPVAFSVIVESMLLALLGGLIGVALVYVALDGLSTNTNFFGDTQYAFRFVVSGDLMAEGLGCALGIGILGGVLPAVRAGRMPIVNALSEQ
jgi:putative ABC transport system permease protein